MLLQRYICSYCVYSALINCQPMVISTQPAKTLHRSVSETLVATLVEADQLQQNQNHRPPHNPRVLILLHQRPRRLSLHRPPRRARSRNKRLQQEVDRPLRRQRALQLLL